MMTKKLVLYGENVNNRRMYANLWGNSHVNDATVSGFLVSGTINGLLVYIICSNSFLICETVRNNFYKE